MNADFEEKKNENALNFGLSNNSILQQDEWRNLLESSTNLIPQHSTSRIQRSFKGIEKEAQRLSSKQSRHVAANQLFVT